MKRSRRGRPAGPGSLPRHPGFLSRRAWFRTIVVVAALAAASLILPSGLGTAAQRTSPPSLKSLIAQAKQLQNQINALSEQYDGLRIQLTQARQAEHIAAATAARDADALGAGQVQVGHLAAESYMTGSVDPTLQFIASSDPQIVVQRAAIIQQLDRQKGAQVSALTAAENTARRAQGGRRAAGTRGHWPGQADAGQDQGHHRQDEQAERRGVPAGDGRLQPDRLVPPDQDSRR